jgi:DNA-binding FadR family transcriptional regulator
MVRQLFEVRRIIEVPTVRLAAVRATDDQRMEIAATAALARPTMPLPEFRALDRQFHALIARAADNPVLAEVELKVLESLSPTGHGAPTDGPLTAQDKRIVRESAAAHRGIARAITASDPDAAERAAARHLEQVEEWLLSTL